MISVLTAVHDPERRHLEACLASVATQTIDDWQHVVVDDGSTEPYVGEVLDRAAADPRVVVVRRDRAGGIVAASREALAHADGEFVALLDHDDVLEPDALELMVGALTAGADLAYSDHDILTPEGNTTLPSFKPDFSPEQLRNQNYVLHLVAARRAVVEAVGGFRPGFDGAQDHDLLLRITERTDRVTHVPHVLYHWRQARRSVAADPSAKPWAYDAGVRAVQEHCDRTGIVATVEPTGLAGAYRVRRRLDTADRVSVVIPTRGSSRPVWGVERCFVAAAVESLVETSTHPDLEFVVVHDRETPASVLRYLEVVAGDRLVLVEYDRPFNFSDKMNVGAAAASGDLLLLLNDDTELIAPDSIEVMAALLDDDSIGMVGAKLLFADGTVQDAGHVYNEHVLPGLVGWHGTSPGPGQLRPLAVEREVAGVTAAVAMLRRSTYEEVGGFDPVLWMNFNDVDLSLKIRATGRRIVWTPYASWHHFESQTRPPSAEPEEFVEIDRRWHDEINRDPYYNPNLAPRRTDWLERPWHSGHPPLDDVDTEASHGAWLRERISDTSWGAQLASIQGRMLLTALALVIAVAATALGDGSSPGVLRTLVFGALPIATWLLLASVALFRRRHVLTSAVVIAAAPSVITLLAGASGLVVIWVIGIGIGVAIGPLWRRRPALAVGAGVVGLAVSVAIDRALRPVDVDGRGLAWSIRQPVTGGGPNPTAAWISAGLWWVGLLAIAGFVWVARHRLGAALIVVSSLAIGLVPWVFSAFSSASAHTVALAAVVGVTVAVAARVDHDRPGARRLFDVVSVVVVAAWAVSAVGVVAA